MTIDTFFNNLNPLFIPLLNNSISISFIHYSSILLINLISYAYVLAKFYKVLCFSKMTFDWLPMINPYVWPFSFFKLMTDPYFRLWEKILPSIISHDQNGYLKNRFIGFNVRTILDAIEHSVNNKLDTLLAFLDFEKAFDKINWDFLDDTLIHFGFGPTFRKWIRIMYNDISSAVLNNGFTSNYFTLKCGIRQG